MCRDATAARLFPPKSRAAGIIEESRGKRESANSADFLLPFTAILSVALPPPPTALSRPPSSLYDVSNRLITNAGHGRTRRFAVRCVITEEDLME